MTPWNSTILKQTKVHIGIGPLNLLLLCSDHQLFRPPDVPVSQVKVSVEVLVGRDGRRVVCCGTLCGEVLPSQNSGESEMPNEAHQRRPWALSLRGARANQLQTRKFQSFMFFN